MDVKREWPAGAKTIIFGPYPADKLTYKSSSWVRYETPALSDGLGTESFRLLKNELRIQGTAILLGSAPDLLKLAVRLEARDADLVSEIIAYTESTKDDFEHQ